MKNVLRGGRGDAWCLVLDKDRLDDSVLNDGGVARRTVTSEQTGGIEAQAGLVRKVPIVVCQDVDERVVPFVVFFPSFGREDIVHSNDVDALNTLGGELVGLLDVSWNLARAWRCECAWNANNDVYIRAQSVKYLTRLCARPPTLASETSKVNGALLWVVLFEFMRGNLCALRKWLVLLQLINEARHDCIFKCVMRMN